MKKSERNKNKYSKLRGLAPQIAKECDADPDYVRKVLRGFRTPKTDRATKLLHIYSVANRYLQAFNNQSNN